MELFLFRRAEFDRLYNCSAYDINDVPLEQRVHPYHGWFMIALCSFFVIIYMPCLSIIVCKYVHKTAYQLMLSIGVADVLMLAVVIIPYGVQSLTGDIFCSYPTPLFFIGCLSMGLWVTSTELGVVLAFYRCCELWRHSVADALFGGYRTLIWITLSWLHCFAILMFTMPIVYIPSLGTMLLNPHFGYLDDPEGKFYNNHHRIYNRIILAIAVLLYFMFVYVIIHQRQKIGTCGPSRSLLIAQRKSLAQALIIESCGAISDAYWAIVLMGPSPPQIAIFIGMYTWILCHGVPGFVYLCMNRSVRNSLMAMFPAKIKCVIIKKDSGMGTTGVVSSLKNNTKTVEDIE